MTKEAISRELVQRALASHAQAVRAGTREVKSDKVKSILFRSANRMAKDDKTGLWRWGLNVKDPSKWVKPDRPSRYSPRRYTTPTGHVLGTSVNKAGDLLDFSIDSLYHPTVRNLTRSKRVQGLPSTVSGKQRMRRDVIRDLMGLDIPNRDKALAKDTDIGKRALDVLRRSQTSTSAADALDPGDMRQVLQSWQEVLPSGYMISTTPGHPAVRALYLKLGFNPTTMDDLTYNSLMMRPFADVAESVQRQGASERRRLAVKAIREAQERERTLAFQSLMEDQSDPLVKALQSQIRTSRNRLSRASRVPSPAAAPVPPKATPRPTPMPAPAPSITPAGRPLEDVINSLPPLGTVSEPVMSTSNSMWDDYKRQIAGAALAGLGLGGGAVAARSQGLI